MKRLITALSILLSLQSFATGESVDGTWHQTDLGYGVYVDWNTISNNYGYWEGEILPSGPYATATVFSYHKWHSHNNYSAMFSITNNVELQNLIITEHLGVKFKPNNGYYFSLVNNPCVMNMAPRTGPTSFIGDNTIRGDNTTLTIKNGCFSFEVPTSSSYAISSYNLVDVKNVRDFKCANKGGIVDGNVRLENVQMTMDLKDNTVTATPISGKLTVGKGVSVASAINTAKMVLPDVIERENGGMFYVYKNNYISNITMNTASTYLNAEGRFPTWFIMGLTSKAFNFCGYDNENGFIEATIPNVDNLSASTTSNDTISITQTTTLEENCQAAAVRISNNAAQLTLNSTLTLGNKDEPGVFMYNTGKNVLGTGELKFAGTDGFLILNNGISSGTEFNPQITGDATITMISGTWQCDKTSDGAGSCATIYLTNTNNTFSGGMDILIGEVKVNNAGALGTGPIRALGNIEDDRIYGGNDGKNPLIVGKWNTPYSRGGAIAISAGYLKGANGKVGIVTNELFLSGAGHRQGNVYTPQGALRMIASNLSNVPVVSGPITLLGNSSIGVDRKGILLSRICGPYKVYFWPWWQNNTEFVFNGTIAPETTVAFTCAGRIVSGLGKIVLGRDALIPQEEIINDATLIFETERTFKSALTGFGTYMQTNDFNTVFTKAYNQGGLELTNGTVTFNVESNSVAKLRGSGDIFLSDGSTFTVGATLGYPAKNEIYEFSGDIKNINASAEATIVKEGDNTLSLGVVPSYNGELIIKEGTVLFPETIESSTQLNAKIIIAEGATLKLNGRRLKATEIENNGTIITDSPTEVTISAERVTGNGTIGDNVTIKKGGFMIIVK